MTDDLDHLVCCDPNTALCGADVTSSEWTTQPDPAELCTVCKDLSEHACPRCGQELDA